MANEAMKLCFGCMKPLDTYADCCPHCGYKNDGNYDRHYLKPGTIFGEGRYLAGKFARKNGEACVYLGYDFRTRESCWIKEYFPTTISRRDLATGDLLPMEGFGAQYKALMSDFVDVCNEIKRLGVTELVIPIRDVVYANKTVYAIYEKLDVVPYEEYLVKNGGKLPLAKAREILLPFCYMVSCIHDHGFIHRGISPYTVYADADDHLYLWDFSLGATRTANSELDAELFNGYSAPEQYASNGWQGTWTDVYAVAALFYRTLSGFVPPKSTLVGEDRPIATLNDLVVDMPHNISEAVEDAMALSAEERTQTVYAFTARLIETQTSGTAVYDTAKTKKLYERQQKKRENARGLQYLVLALFFTVFVLIGGLWLVVTTYLPDLVSSSGTSSRPSSQRPESVSEIDSSSVPASELPSSLAPEDTRVPRFIGQMLSVVENDTDYAGRFKFSVKEEFNDTFPAGVIYDQSPKENTLMPNEGTVILYVSKGAELVEMPNLIGIPYEDALKALGDHDPPLSCIKTERFSAGAEAGNVVGTTPSPGDKFDPDTQTIYVFVMPEDNVTDASTASKKPEDNAIRRD